MTHARPPSMPDTPPASEPDPPPELSLTKPDDLQGDPGAEQDIAAIAKLASGRTSALEGLAERHERTMLSIALALTSRRHDAASDIVQEAWLRVLRKAKSYQGNGTPRAWLAAITVNAARDHLRRERTRKRKELNLTPEPSHSDTTADQQELLTALTRLTDPERELVLLAHCRNLTNQEAATALAIPLGTFKTRLRSAMTVLRQLMQHDTQEEAKP